MGQVRGVSFIGTFKYLRKHYGPDAPSRALAAMPPALREIFGANGETTVESGWYDCAALTELTREIDRIWGKGDLALAREIGRELAFDDLNRFFKWLLKLAGPKTLFTRAGSVWKNYHNVGRYVVEAVEDHRASIRIEDWDSASHVMCRRIEGWIERALELTLGLDLKPVIRETHHLVQDPRVSPHLFCRFEAKWS